MARMVPQCSLLSWLLGSLLSRQLVKENFDLSDQTQSFSLSRSFAPIHISLAFIPEIPFTYFCKAIGFLTIAMVYLMFHTNEKLLYILSMYVYLNVRSNIGISK